MLSKANPSYYLFRHMEKKLYEISDAIGCMSQGNIEYLLKHNNIPETKLHLLPNWTTVSKTEEIKQNILLDKLNLDR